MPRRLRETLSGGYFGENRKCKPVHYNVSSYGLYRGSLSHDPSEIGIGAERLRLGAPLAFIRTCGTKKAHVSLAGSPTPRRHRPSHRVFERRISPGPGERRDKYAPLAFHAEDSGRHLLAFVRDGKES